MNSENTICYEVKDWAIHFENSESRKIKSLTWVPVKNKHDGKSYRRVSKLPNGVQVFCAWSLIIQVASKMPTRGMLRDEDGPITTADLADMTGFPESIFEMALKALSEPKIGWLIVVNLPESPETSRRVGVEGNGTEQKGTEGNGTEVGEGAREVPDFEQAFAQTVTAAIPKDFCQWVFDDWSSRSGKDGGGNLVQWLPYVVKRWAREQVEWKAGTHKGNKRQKKNVGGNF